MRSCEAKQTGVSVDKTGRGKEGEVKEEIRGRKGGREGGRV